MERWAVALTLNLPDPNIRRRRFNCHGKNKRHSHGRSQYGRPGRSGAALCPGTWAGIFTGAGGLVRPAPWCFAPSFQGSAGGRYASSGYTASTSPSAGSTRTCANLTRTSHSGSDVPGAPSSHERQHPAAAASPGQWPAAFALPVQVALSQPVAGAHPAFGHGSGPWPAATPRQDFPFSPSSNSACSHDSASHLWTCGPYRKCPGG